MTGLFNDERLRINYFWLIGKKELEDRQAELRNKEREL
jgi:growth arrest-specific protein 8